MNVVRTRRRGEVVKLELLLLFVVDSLDLFVIQLFHIKSYYKPFFPATSIQKTTSADRYAKANAPGVLLLYYHCVWYLQFNYFSLPFRILFKNYHNKLFTYFQVDFVYGILKFFFFSSSS